MPNVVLNNIQYAYLDQNEEHLVLDGVELTINHGESIGIMGASGSGKSTLLNILSGLLKPKLGEVLYDDISIWRLSSSERTAYRSQNIGFMFQNQHFFSELSVLDNLSLPLRVLKKTNIEDTVRQYLEMMQLDKQLYHRYPNELSGGERARVGLARALVHKPQILIADEPTSSLDDALTHVIFNDIHKLQNQLGFTLVVATHDDSLKQYLDRIYNV